MADLEENSLRSVPAQSDLTGVDEAWTEGQFEALVCLHMLKPGHVLTEDECWAIEYTRQQADEVENNAVDAFDQGRKHGMVSVAGKTDASMFEELELLRSKLAVERALCRHYMKLAGLTSSDDGPVSPAGYEAEGVVSSNTGDPS